MNNVDVVVQSTATMNNEPSKLGILYGISVGTGDPELITVKGLRLLQQSDVVAFPAGVENNLGIAEAIVTPWLKSGQTKLALHFPYVRDEKILLSAWQEAAEQIWNYLKDGRDVAFACEGDISFYSTFNYLDRTLHQLHSQVEIERIPGISSPLAAASVLDLPLTERNQKLMVLPALYNLEDLEAALDVSDVVVLMKFSSVYDRVWKILQKRNLLDQALIVERATSINQVIYRNLSDFPHLDLPYFSLLIIRVDDPLSS
jgi:precorrin-2/cobalt-factor-2 C20-methyltransferase